VLPFPRVVHTKPYYVTTGHVYSSCPRVRLKNRPYFSPHLLFLSDMTFGLHGRTTLWFAVFLRKWEDKLHCRVGKSYYFLLGGKMTYRQRDMRPSLQLADNVSNSETSKNNFATWCLRLKKTDIWYFSYMILRVVVFFRCDVVKSSKYLQTFRRNLLRLYSIHKTQR